MKEEHPEQELLFAYTVTRGTGPKRLKEARAAMCEGSSSVLPSGTPLVLTGHEPSSLQASFYRK